MLNIVSILIGPRFIHFLRDNEFGQHIREEGPEHHRLKQGTPTMGGLLILLAATIGFLPVSHFRLQSLKQVLGPLQQLEVIEPSLNDKFVLVVATDLSVNSG